MWCFPTWLKEAKAIYKKYCAGLDTNDVEEDVLQMVQEYKEDIVKAFIQNDMGAHWNGLNFFLRNCGSRLGMEDATLDAYSGNAAAPGFSSDLCTWIFMQKYENTHRLVEAIRTKINMEICEPNTLVPESLTDLITGYVLSTNSDLEATDIDISTYMDIKYDEYDELTGSSLNFAGTEAVLQALDVLT